jgi:serine/threonine-protein kinase
MDDLIGKDFGNYTVTEEIGKGGMAVVYKGRQASMNRDVAIKVMSKEHAKNELFVARFKNEAQFIAGLEHAHILPVYDFGEKDDVLYIVMRFLSAGDLSDLIPEEGMEIGQAVDIFSQIASALEYAHSKGIVHRDLKPSNVMLDDQGNAFLTDFGIAKSLTADTNLTATDNVVGTPTYMSPEQGLGEAIDGRSDIYALGAMLYEMLAGRPPFESDNPMSMMLKHINEIPESPTSMREDIPTPIETVVLRALAKEPEDRYQSAAQMAQELQNAYALSEGRTPVSSTPPENFMATAAFAKVDDGTIQLDNAQPSAETMPSPVAAASPPRTMGDAAATRLAQPSKPTPTGPAPKLEVDVTLNDVSQWVAARPAIGTWLEAVGLSGVTFLLLSRLTSGALPEIALLSLFPGILLYGLLKAPTVGALISFVLILIPLMAHAPGLGLIWALVTVIAGSRLNSKEISLTLILTALGGIPLLVALPLAAPWWVRVRRAVLPSALGIFLAGMFAATLGWPNAGGLLPVPQEGPLSSIVVERTLIIEEETDPLTGEVITEAGEETVINGILIGPEPFESTYLSLFEPSTWSPWLSDSENTLRSVGVTVALLGGFLAETDGLLLIIATGWALASVVSVSNRRVQNTGLRASGLGLGLLILLVVHLAVGREGLEPVATSAIGLAVVGGVLAFGLTQFPLQADPNAGNRTGTVLRMLRQALGAAFVAIGVGVFLARLAGDPALTYELLGFSIDVYQLTWGLAVFGTLATITNPLVGPPLVFVGLLLSLALTSPVAAVILAVLLAFLMMVNLLFDRRRPRRWNPLGAGMILGAPGLAQTGLFPLAALSNGALEAQVPATMLAVASHFTLIAAAGGDVNTVGLIAGIAATIAGVLTVERLMGVDLLNELDNKLRRLIFTVPVGVLLAGIYYGVAGIAPELNIVLAILIAAISSAALVLSMGERARYWRRFTEREEAEEDLLEDEEVTGELITTR